MTVRRLTPDDAEPIFALRQQALEAAPLAFGSAPGDDRLSVDFLTDALGPDEPLAMFGHFTDGVLDGMVGVVRSTRAKTAHRADVYSMFVAPAARRRGVGRALVQAAIDACRAWSLDQLHLSVTSAAGPAYWLYESMGFVRWGTEPGALRWGGVTVDEHHMVLHLTVGGS